MTMEDTSGRGTVKSNPVALVPELLEDELADLLAWSIELRQLSWNLGPRARLGLNQLLAEATRDASRWMDCLAERLWDLGVAPSNACVRPLLRPDPTGGRRINERSAGMTAGHLTGELAQRTALRARDERMTDAKAIGLLGAIEKELTIYAVLAGQPERLVR